MLGHDNFRYAQTLLDWPELLSQSGMEETTEWDFWPLLGFVHSLVDSAYLRCSKASTKRSLGEGISHDSLRIFSLANRTFSKEKPEH